MESILVFFTIEIVILLFIVTHPVDALETDLIYFSNTPFFNFDSGCTQFAFLDANSSSEILRLIVFLPHR
jgi:hypothetical protein